MSEVDLMGGGGGGGSIVGCLTSVGNLASGDIPIPRRDNRPAAHTLPLALSDQPSQASSTKLLFLIW